jgi:hypothetical protein
MKRCKSCQGAEKTRYLIKGLCRGCQGVPVTTAPATCGTIRLSGGFVLHFNEFRGEIG